MRPPSFITRKQTSQGNQVSRGTGLLGSHGPVSARAYPSLPEGTCLPTELAEPEHSRWQSPRCREGPVSQNVRGPEIMLRGGDKPEPRGYVPTALGCRERGEPGPALLAFADSSVLGAPSWTLASMMMPSRKCDSVAPKSTLGLPWPSPSFPGSRRPGRSTVFLLGLNRRHNLPQRGGQAGTGSPRPSPYTLSWVTHTSMS